MSVSVVITTKNESSSIGALIHSLGAQTLLPKEVIIVDAYSDDDTVEKIKKNQKSLNQRILAHQRGQRGRSQEKVKSLQIQSLRLQ